MDENLIHRIELNPDIMLGKPVIRGTRIPVELLLRKLSEGATQDELLDAYPRLTQLDLQAAMASWRNTPRRFRTPLLSSSPD